MLSNAEEGLREILTTSPIAFSDHAVLRTSYSLKSSIYLLSPLYYLLYCIYLTLQILKEKKLLILLNVLNWALSKISRSLILLM